MFSSVPTSRSLLGRVRHLQDQQSWNKFVAIYSPLIYAAARWYGLSREDAREVTQDVFARLVKALPGFTYDPGRGHFRSWLMTVTHNAVVSHLRKASQSPRGSGDSGIQAMLELQPDTRRWDEAYAERVLDWAAARARPHFREKTWEAFRLVYLGRCDTHDAARRLGMTYAAVATACSKVKACIEDIIRREGIEL
jgi:RNA polymerase sigma-70 factor, ECF subfamily